MAWFVTVVGAQKQNIIKKTYKELILYKNSK